MKFITFFSLLTAFFLASSVYGTAMKPSDSVNAQTVADIFGWQESDMLISPVSEFSKGRNKVCDFKHGDSFLSLQTKVSSKNAIENKAVERRFKNYLQNGENGINYTEIPASNKTQIFGSKSGPGGMKIYILRQFWGNDSEAKAELMTPSSDKDAILEKLQSLMAELQ